MWIFLPNGPVSIVEHRAFNNVVLVRARSEFPLKTLFPELDPEYMEDADYPYRLTVTKQHLVSALSIWIDTQLTYPNFKAAADPTLQRLYHGVYAEVSEHYNQ